MTRFTYKSLDGWLIPGVGYFKALQEHALDMEREIVSLNRQLSKSGNKYYQRDAAKWGEEWQRKCIEAGEMKRQLIELEAEKDAEIRRLQNEVDYLQEQLEEYQAAQQPNSQRKRNSKNGQFMADIPKAEKMRQAYELSRKGCTLTQIANKLDITSETVKKYIAEFGRKQQEQWLQAQETTLLSGEHWVSQ